MATIELSGAQVHYLEQGRGEPVLLLHSSASSSAQWRALAERLSHHYRVLAPDLYGYGATPQWPGRGAFSLGCEVEIVRALLERAGEPAHLVGHSYGGAVALHAARRYGTELRSLTLIEPVAFHLLTGRDVPAYREIAHVAHHVRQALADGDYVGGYGRFVEYWSPGSWAQVAAEKRVTLSARLPKVALDFHATLGDTRALEDFGALRVPTLLLEGGASRRPTRQICRLLADTLPDALLETVADAGHMLPLTHRDPVNRLIAAHLEEHSFHARRIAPREPAVLTT